MKSVFFKSVFRIICFCARLFTGHYSVCPASKTTEPAVYVVHHQNLWGPVFGMIWFNKPVRPWVLSVFCKQSACFRQYCDYTFTKRFGWPKAFAAAVAFPLSFLVTGLMPLIRGIPVYRSSRAILKTFNQSINALADGENLLICPDIDYTDAGPSMGDMYQGFLDLGKLYWDKTGRHLAFVPLHISRRRRCIYIGNAIYFTAENHYRTEKGNVYDRLKKEFIRLENQAETGSRKFRDA